MGARLDVGDTFPEITLDLYGGGARTLPADLETPWTFVLFYRGHW